MANQHRLIGLSAPRSATLQPLHSDHTTYWAKMPDELWNKWWPFFKQPEENHWQKKWVAVVENGEVVEIYQRPELKPFKRQTSPNLPEPPKG